MSEAHISILLYILGIAVLLRCTAVAVAQECSHNADSLVPMSKSSKRRGFFLSELPSVQCNGTALAWHFCYFTDGQIDRNSKYSTEFGIYRPSNSPVFKYELVPETQTRITRTGNELFFDQPYCDVETLNQSKQFYVAEGDMIGVCVFPNSTDNDYNYIENACGRDDPESSCGNITVSAKNANGYSLEHASFLTCYSSLPTHVYYLTTLVDHVLHVSLEVGKCIHTTCICSILCTMHGVSLHVLDTGSTFTEPKSDGVNNINIAEISHTPPHIEPTTTVSYEHSTTIQKIPSGNS